MSKIIFWYLIMCDTTPGLGSENSFSVYFDLVILYTLSKSPIYLTFSLLQQIVAPDFRFFIVLPYFLQSI